MFEETSEVDMSAADLDIYLVRGDDFLLPLTFKSAGSPLNVSGNTYQAKVRKSPNSEDLLLFSIDDAEASVGVIEISLTSAQTSVLFGNHYWELEQTDQNGKIRTIVNGNIIAAESFV